MGKQNQEVGAGGPPPVGDKRRPYADGFGEKSQVDWGGMATEAMRQCGVDPQVASGLLKGIDTVKKLPPKSLMAIGVGAMLIGYGIYAGKSKPGGVGTEAGQSKKRKKKKA